MASARPPDSILIWGPPASGKSRAALAYFRDIPGALLLTPSSTMAEHLRNQLARSGEPVRPSRILTLAQFLEQSGAPAAASATAIDFAIGAALEQLQPARFREVAAYPGFRRALAALIQEVGGASLPGELSAIAHHVEQCLATQNMALHSARVMAVEGRCHVAALVLDGFFTFAPAELALIRNISRIASVIVTLPDWDGAHSARSTLLAAGFAEQRMSRPHRAPSMEIIRAANIEREVEEIARRIVEEASHGRAFRDMGVVLRAAEPYAAALQTTFARFGIPARFYFAEPLDSSHPAIQFIAGLVDVMLKGWDHAELLALLRMPVSGIGVSDPGDQLDFALRDRLPGRGLPGIVLPEILSAILDDMNSWTRDHLTPLDWARRCAALRKLVPGPCVDEPASRERFHAWISTAAALDGFDAAIEHAAQLLPTTRVPFEEFWPRAKAAIDLTDLRTPDRRRDVVHVIDVFEARQWELPIVFVCGMIERHFPQYHREDAILDDAARRRAGLKTSVDLQREERSLYELAISRATVRTILSYPRFDERGEQTLPSFFLESAGADIDDVRVRPRPARHVTAQPNTDIRDRALLQYIAEKNRKLSPSSIETYLQCPFQFFARRTLKLRERPLAPRDRLNALLQGTIIHAAIAELERMPLLGADVLDAVFDEECAKHRIPLVYRTETVRLDMLRSFNVFLKRRASGLGWKARVEEPFEIVLTPDLTVRGRIDRLEISPNGEALVIDYKYSAANAIKQRVKSLAAGEGVQAGLYLLAAVKQFGLKPAGMLYCGLRNGVEWGGWHVPLSALVEIGESCTPAVLDEMTADSASIALSCRTRRSSQVKSRFAQRNRRNANGATIAIFAAPRPHHERPAPRGDPAHGNGHFEARQEWSAFGPGNPVEFVWPLMPHRDKAMNLSSDQLAAIRREGQDVCVVAGPGSGKTTVLIERFAWLVEEKGIDPARILAITFTEKAATEIKARLIERFQKSPELRESIERAWVSTIHGFCARLLRENAIAAGLAPDFTVLEQPAADRMARESAEETLDAMFAEQPAEMRRLFQALDLATEDWGSKPDLARALLDVQEAMRAAGVHELPAAIEPENVWRRARELAQIVIADRTASGAHMPALRDFANRLLALGDAIGPAHFETLARSDSFHLNRIGKGTRVETAARELKNELADKLERQWVAQLYRDSARVLRDAIRRIRARYDQRKRAEAAIDFSGLEEETIRLLESDPQLPERAAARFDQILMDELQDTNPLQWRLTGLIRRGFAGGFFGVGDVNQSIYGFRYAEPAVFTGYRARLVDSGAQLDQLRENRRSVEQILDTVSRILDGQPGIEPRPLISTRGGSAENPVELLIGRDDETTGVDSADIEASMIAARIHALRREGAEYSDIAILVRTLGAAEAIERALDRAAIPFLVSGGRTFMEAREILDVLSLIGALVNPLDEIALVGVLRSPLVGMTDEEILRAGSEGWRAEFARLFGNFRPTAGFVAPDRIIAQALDECGYAAGLSERARANIDKLLAYIRREHLRRPRALAEWLQDLEALRETQSEAEAPPPDAGNVVRVMTIHAAKGLEFPIVFVSALHRGTDQSKPVIAFSPAAGLGAKWRNPATGKGIADREHAQIIDEMKTREAAEENRLLYVAMTRAENRLILSFAEKKRTTNWMKLVRATIHPTAIADRLIEFAPEETSSGAAPRARDRIVDPPAHVSHRDGSAAVTAIALFRACPRKYLLTSITQAEPTTPVEADGAGGMEFGSAVHKILAGAEIDHAEAAELAARFRSSEFGARAARANRIEREFDFLFDFEDTVLRGQIDLWFEEAGELVVVDYKTDRDESPETYALQLQIYALALERYAGRIADRAVLYYLRSDRVIEIPIDQEKVRTAVRVFLQAQESLEYPLNAGEQCRRCLFFGKNCVGTGLAASG